MLKHLGVAGGESHLLTGGWEATEDGGGVKVGMIIADVGRDWRRSGGNKNNAIG